MARIAIATRLGAVDREVGSHVRSSATLEAGPVKAAVRPAAAPSTSRPYRLWYGRDAAPLAGHPIRAGVLDAVLDGPDVTRIALHGVPLVERVHVAVRDRDWGTIPPVVTPPTFQVRGGVTEVTFEAEHREGAIDLRWHGAITATPDGTLTCVMDGEARRDFDYCRIGFCVLYPALTAAGRPYRAETVAGSVLGRLPEPIAPQAIVDGVEIPLVPAFRRLELGCLDATVVAELEGDLFELEDQRNWTDSSFKAYCTPISLGYPHRARQGQRFRQVVRITVVPARPLRPSVRRPVRPELRVSAEDGRPGPRLGVGSAPGPDRDLSPREARRLRSIGVDHLRVDVHLSDPGWPVGLRRCLRDADAIGAGLEVALFVRDDTADRLPALVQALDGRRPARVLVFHEPTAGIMATPAGWVPRVRAMFGDLVADVPIATGTDGDFAELNRDRPDLSDADAVCYSMNPQVHLSDDRSLMQTLPAQAATVATARAFAPGLDVVVSPVTLRQRFNPVASATASTPDARDDVVDAAVRATLPPIVPGVDVRQPTLFAAAWVIGSYASLAAGGAASVTYFETVGRRGLMAATTHRRGQPPGLEGIPHGGVFPVYHALADVAGCSGWRCTPIVPAGLDTLVGLTMRQGDRLRVLVANVTPATMIVTLALPPVAQARVRVLDERTAASAMTTPARFRVSGWRRLSTRGATRLRLLPYACARIDARLR
jgi:D-apionolactonase